MSRLRFLENALGCGERRLYHSIGTAQRGKSVTRTKMVNEWLVWLAVNLLILLGILVALPGLEPGLFALRGRRVNQLHHNAIPYRQKTEASTTATKSVYQSTVNPATP